MIAILFTAPHSRRSTFLADLKLLEYKSPVHLTDTIETPVCDVPTGKEAIIDAAARCFMEAGFSATSIDDVAHELGATKGRIYHYYRSKVELFFDVHRAGMAINLRSIEPIVNSKHGPFEKLDQMCRAHIHNMLANISYQRVVMQGVEMHLYCATTPMQRKELAVLMKEREYYEGLFRKVLVDGKQNGVFDFENPSFASKAVLAMLNNPVLWYDPKRDSGEAGRLDIIEQFTKFALNTVLKPELKTELLK